MRLSALRKLIFGVHGVQEMFFLSFERLNFKTKVVARENELRERIPVPHDNFFKAI